MTKQEKIRVARFWLGAGFGLLLLMILDTVVASGLTNFLTRFPLSDLHRQTLVWLRAPLAILGSEILFSFLEPWILRFRFPSIAEEVATMSDQSQITLFRVPKEKWNAAVFTSTKRAVWISDRIRKQLNDSELKFILHWQVVGLTRHHFGKSVLFSAILMATLLFPYLLLVQMVPYFLSGNWIIPAWLGLYGLLFVLNSFLLGRFENSQYYDQTDEAACSLNFSEDQKTNLENKLILLKSESKTKTWTVPNLINSKYTDSLTKNRGFRFTWRPQLVFMLVVVGMTAIFVKSYLWPVYQLRIAAAEGDLSKVKMFVAAGTNLNQVDFLSNGRTPLLSAVESGRVNVVIFLLEKGSDPNHFNAIGFSPLLVAADRGHLELTRLLLSYGAQVNFRGFKGYTPLMVAAAHGHLETAEVLVMAKADINARSRFGSTALLLAVSGVKVPLVEYLVNNGADLSAKDQDGDDAITLAKRKKLTIIEKLLTDASQRKGK